MEHEADDKSANNDGNFPAPSRLYHLIGLCAPQGIALAT
ncbi:hypothetical protein Z947_1492 [Sulfitobacter geojensis]|nr:hypothetical protein Z947_1492 [Sulfitobacter geojensis]